ncbi:hypothetical protein [Mesorhizobium sp.]|nr:hypothetical protein [Mesorhizobium sp.]
MRRTLFISLGVLVAIGLLGYVAHSMNLVGMIMSMPTPAQH